MSNRINKRLEQDGNILSIYFTAGFPKLQDTKQIIIELAEAGVDLIEIGLPFSDPLADGPTIQASSTQALDNGMHTALLFEQLEGIREQVDIPLIIMGYYNPVMQYGPEAFCKKCQELGIDGLILPDLPLHEYSTELKPLMEQYGLSFVPLITPQTTDKRIGEIDQLSDSFIYMVSSASTTGSQGGLDSVQQQYFDRIHDMQLQHPQIVGFGIGDMQSFKKATAKAKGAIIGSAFIRMLAKDGVSGIKGFIQEIRPKA